MARFDFFHRQSLVPDLQDYNDYTADEAIEFVVDILQLIEASHPKLVAAELDDVPPEMKKYYSKRTGLWMVPQDNEFFKDSFRRNSDQQRQAANQRDCKTASGFSKIKTKECRYSVPVDALKKGFAQKIALEKYRATVLENAQQAEDNAVLEAVRPMSILALRQRALDKDLARAQEMNLPLWPRAVSNDAARIGHLATTFLNEQSVIIKNYIAGALGGPDNLSRDENGGALENPKEKAVTGDQLICDFEEADRSKIITCIAAFLKAPDKVTKLSQLKFQGATKESGVALGILTALGAIKKVTWKPEGKTGYAGAYILKNTHTDSELGEIKLTNLLREEQHQYQYNNINNNDVTRKNNNKNNDNDNNEGGNNDRSTS